MLYCDYVTYLQNKLGSDYVVANTRNIEANLDKVNVVITETPGMIYDDSATLGIQLDIYTTTPGETAQVLFNFCAENNNTSFIERGYVIRQTYTTPSPFERDIHIGTNNYTRLVMIGDLYIMFNVSQIDTMKIDDEKVDFLSVSMPYTATLHSKLINNVEISTNRKTAATVSLSFSCIHKETIFINKVRLIRLGQLSGTTQFTIDITYLSGISEQYTMMLQSSIASFPRNSLPKLDVVMVRR